MTTVLEEPADLLRLVGQRLGTTDWINQDQVDRFADATGDPERGAVVAATGILGSTASEPKPQDQQQFSAPEQMWPPTAATPYP
jgi:hypothetical protein